MQHGEPKCELRISFADWEETLLVTPIGPNLYRLEESAVLGEGFYHDVIETEPQTDGPVRFLRVLTPSGMTTECWVVPQSVLDSPELSLCSKE
jgi:hypothetical protein